MTAKVLEAELIADAWAMRAKLQCYQEAVEERRSRHHMGSGSYDRDRLAIVVADIIDERYAQARSDVSGAVSRLHRLEYPDGLGGTKMTPRAVKVLLRERRKGMA